MRNSYGRGTLPTLIEVIFDVKNTGKQTSDEVIQIYASAPKSRVPKPRRQLLAFERLHDIAPDEVRHVIKRISTNELRFYDCISGSFLVEEGNYMIFVGPSSKETPLYDTIFLAGEKTKTRVLTKRIRADHFDEYENIELTQGIMTFTAATAKDKEKPALLQWRDCQAMEAREVHFLAKSVKGGSIELCVNGKRAAFWSGDTRLYEPTPMFGLDNNAKKEREEQQKICEPIYSDITVPFEQIGSIKQESQTVSIQMTGDISLCCFWLR